MYQINLATLHLSEKDEIIYARRKKYSYKDEGKIQRRLIILLKNHFNVLMLFLCVFLLLLVHMLYNFTLALTLSLATRFMSPWTHLSPSCNWFSLPLHRLSQDRCFYDETQVTLPFFLFSCLSLFLSCGVLLRLLLHLFMLRQMMDKYIVRKWCTMMLWWKKWWCFFGIRSPWWYSNSWWLTIDAFLLCNNWLGRYFCVSEQNHIIISNVLLHTASYASHASLSPFPHAYIKKERWFERIFIHQ